MFSSTSAKSETSESSSADTDVDVEWDPAASAHDYYNLNPTENILYRFSYDTGIVLSVLIYGKIIKI